MSHKHTNYSKYEKHNELSQYKHYKDIMYSTMDHPQPLGAKGWLQSSHSAILRKPNNDCSCRPITYIVKRCAIYMPVSSSVYWALNSGAHDLNTNKHSSIEWEKCVGKFLLNITLYCDVSFLRIMTLNGKLLKILIPTQNALFWRHKRLAVSQWHGSPTCGLPGCIMRSEATFVNCASITKIVQ